MQSDALFEIDALSAPDGWVYVIGPATSSVVKIGTAKSVKKRLGSLQTGHPEVLVARWYTPGDMRLEKKLHARFSRLRKAGEWFDFGALDPVVEIRSAVEALTGDPGCEPEGCSPRGVVEPPQPMRPEFDYTGPDPSDPDYGNPLYEQQTCGCRFLTPAECVAEGDSPDAAIVASRGYPLEGHTWCFNSH